MLRAVTSLALAVLLAACWGSDERFFGPGDWAKLEFDGAYRIEALDEDDDAPRSVTMRVLPDGLIEIVPRAGRGEKLTLGLVGIPGGSGGFFLAVDRSAPANGTGDLYVMAKVTANSLELYFPDCLGTPPIPGMDKSEGLAGEACGSQNEAALFEAARLAERFLSERHIVAVSPFTRFEKIDPADSSQPIED